MQTIEKQCRVLKLEMEEQAGKFSVKHTIFPWLVNHAADVLTKFQVHEDGLTSYERIKGRAYPGTMLNLGQCILYKVAPKVSGGEMGARWEKGMWLGKSSHLMSTSSPPRPAWILRARVEWAIRMRRREMEHFLELRCPEVWRRRFRSRAGLRLVRK